MDPESQESSDRRHRGVLLAAQFRLEEEIGRGAMGTVFRARDEALDRDVAVKFMLPEAQTDSEQVERFRREATAMAAVRHKNVLQIFNFGEYEGTPYFVMELIEGQTAAQLLARHRQEGVLPALDVALDIVLQVADGLAVVHQRGVMHRDIKPENIMVEHDTGRAVIMDFGIGKRYTAQNQRRTIPSNGTPAYVAPEIAAGLDVTPEQDHLSDIYALGVTAFELMTGDLPFSGQSWLELCVKHVTEPPPAPSSRRGEITAELDAIILRCLAKSPDQRYQTGDQLASALHSCLGAARPVQSRPSRVARRKESAQGRGALARINGPLRVIVSESDMVRLNWYFNRIQDSSPGCRFEAARSNSTAYQLALASAPLVLVAPLEDPELNGLELAASLLGRKGFERLHIILTADRVSAAERALLESIGVFKVLPASASESEFLQVLSEIAPRLDGAQLAS